MVVGSSIQKSILKLLILYDNREQISPAINSIKSIGKDKHNIFQDISPTNFLIRKKRIPTEYG